MLLSRGGRALMVRGPSSVECRRRAFPVVVWDCVLLGVGVGDCLVCLVRQVCSARRVCPGMRDSDGTGRWAVDVAVCVASCMLRHA